MVELSKRKFQVVVSAVDGGKALPNSRTISVRESDYDGTHDELVNKIKASILG